NNIFPKLLGAYNYYKREIFRNVQIIEENKTRKEVDEQINEEQGENENQEKIPGQLKAILDSLDIYLEHSSNISNLCYGLILVFFSLSQFVLEMIYLLENPDEDIFSFKKQIRRGGGWDALYKRVLDFNHDRKLEEMYYDLQKIKRKYRNPLAHGLNDEISLLVPFLGKYLVPSSYHLLNNNLYHGLFQFEKEEANEIITSFDKFFVALESIDPFTCHMAYLKSGMNIPMDVNELKELKSRMTSCKEFNEYIERELYKQEKIINRELY
ncbi:MAG: hypothetical protein ACFFD4_38670, partial [Candidatus Odinarchaeota archaeon]